MISGRWFRSLLFSIVIILTPAVSFAWNYTGHLVIASIAYRQLDDQTKQKIAEVLKKHPAYADLSAHRPTNGPDEILNLLWNASVFPDDARSEPWWRYRRLTRTLCELPHPGEQGRTTSAGREHSQLLRRSPAPDPEPTDLGRG